MSVADLGWEAYYTLAVIAAIVAALVRDLARADLVLLGGLGLLLLAGVVEPIEGFQGFANPAVVTIGALFVVAAGVQRTEALQGLDRLLFAPRGRLPGTLLRLMTPSMVLSAFMNNTPLVAMLIPRVQTWAARRRLPVSKLLIPLSYATILGGMTTLLGTSTNIIVHGLLLAEGYEGLGLFSLAWVGLPAALAALAYFVAVGHRLLPDRGVDEGVADDGLKDCLFEVRVPYGSPLAGQTVEEAGLRALGDAYLVHVGRDGQVLSAGPSITLRADDTLAFVGGAAALERLLAMPGLARALAPVGPSEETMLPLYEAVVAETSELVGRTLREVAFRERYRGVVLAVQRQDERVTSPLGRTPIHAGDLLLIESADGFDRTWNQNRREFYLVAPRRPERPRPLTGRAPVALALLCGMVLTVAVGLLSLPVAALSAALAMIAFGCVRGTQARASIDGTVLVAIAATFGIAHAVRETGLAAVAAGGITTLAGTSSTLAALFVLYLATMLFTEVLTNNAAAILMLPVGLDVAGTLGLDPSAVAIVIAVAASASFITPIGYQTNLMVMAAGSYRFTDYTRVGLPVSLVVMVVAVLSAYWHWG